MQHLEFWFDPVSPYAYLAFERLPQALEGLSYHTSYRPVLFAALLKHHQHKGPAEIEAKRAWTYRHVAWLARAQGVELQMPQAHPFNPLPLLRLALACCEAGGTPNRRVVEALFHHVWRGGRGSAGPPQASSPPSGGGLGAAQPWGHSGVAADDPARLQALAQALAPPRDPQGDAVKAELRAATDAAIAAGVFGVPSLRVGGRLFWGLDALPMVAAAMRGDPWFDGPGWTQDAAARPGVQRRAG
jgi:2-hydroxychromene-2-carboxylate isomerase